MQKIKINDIEFAYERRGRGAPLVLIHGYPLDHSIWKDLTLFLKDDFDLILPDVRGFGESPAGNVPYSMSDLAGDIASLLDALGINEAALAGHSMGGYVALAFARAFPMRVAGLALVSSQAAGDSPERKDIRYKTAAEVERNGVQSVADAMTDKLAPSQWVRDVLRTLIERQSAASVIGALKAMAGREDLTSFLPSFRFPLVVVHDKNDELIPAERAMEVAALVPSAHLTLLSGTGHMPMLEKPEETAAALRRLR